MNCVSRLLKDSRLLALNRVPFLKAREKLTLMHEFADISDVFRLSRRDLEYVLGRRILSERWSPGDFLRQGEEDLKNLTKDTIRCIFYEDDEYPPQLKEIPDSPFLLFVRGKAPDYSRPCVGVVGTRHPTSCARSAAFSLGLDLAGLGVPVVSGLARGIDAESHAGCLEGGGTAIAVLGNGLNTIYPPSSRKIGMEILKQGGMLLSEYTPETPPVRHNFPGRNRIISGLSRSVVVIQAPERSGALITADFALDQGRDLFVHQAGLGGVAGRGSENLRRDGAGVISGGKEILEDWMNFHCRRLPEGSMEEPGKAEAPGRDELSGGGPGCKLAHLLELELEGQVILHNGDYFSKQDGV
jgi:DNA processing protein